MERTMKIVTFDDSGKPVEFDGKPHMNHIVMFVRGLGVRWVSAKAMKELVEWNERAPVAPPVMSMEDYGKRAIALLMRGQQLDGGECNFITMQELVLAARKRLEFKREVEVFLKEIARNENREH